MDDKDFLDSLGEEAKKASEAAKSDGQDRDEIQRLLDGQTADPLPAAPALADPADEPTSVLEMLRQASESVTPEAKAPPKVEAAPRAEVPPKAAEPFIDPLEFEEPAAEPSPAEPATQLYESDPDGYNKAQSWLDGEGTTSAPGATQGRMREMRSTLRGRTNEDPAGTGAAEPETAENPLEKLRLARERLRQGDTGEAKLKPKRIPAKPRMAARQEEAGWRPSAADRRAARKAKRGAAKKKAKAVAAERRRAEQRSPEGWQGRVATLLCLMLVATAVQIMVMGKFGAGLSIKDLAAGLSVAFPVLFMMLAIRPEGLGQWAAVLFCYGAIVVVGSAVYALSLWMGRIGPLADTVMLTRLTLILGIYVVCWGPLYLFTVWLMTRLELWPEDRVSALAG